MPTISKQLYFLFLVDKDNKVVYPKIVGKSPTGKSPTKVPKPPTSPPLTPATPSPPLTPGTPSPQVTPKTETAPPVTKPQNFGR